MLEKINKDENLIKLHCADCQQCDRITLKHAFQAVWALNYVTEDMVSALLSTLLNFIFYLPALIWCLRNTMLV